DDHGDGHQHDDLDQLLEQQPSGHQPEGERHGAIRDARIESPPRVPLPTWTHGSYPANPLRGVANEGGEACNLLDTLLASAVRCGTSAAPSRPARRPGPRAGVADRRGYQAERTAAPARRNP